MPERGSMPNENFLDQEVTKSQVVQAVANKRESQLSPLAEIERDASAQGILSRDLNVEGSS